MASTAKRATRKSSGKKPKISIVEPAAPKVYTNEDLVRRREAAVPRGVASAAPVYASYAENAELWDVDGKRFIDFVGGIRGLGELERRCSEDCVVAFALYPITMKEIMDVADAGLIMPPKSTWFEPKPRSGFVVRCFEENSDNK